MNPVVAAHPAVGDRPAITYRAAGDRYLLVEYGEMTMNLELNFFVLAVTGSLAGHPPGGLIEAAPGFRSLLLHYDPARITQQTLVGALEEIHSAQPAVRSLRIPSRKIVLPLAFDDAASREAVRRYATTIRADAPNVRDDSNIDYILEYNGLPDHQALSDTVLGTPWWNAYTGFFPGLPFLFPLDPRNAITVPKYNPTRTWTAEGAVGIGGPCVAIYPVEAPGGYQLFGRTVPVYDILARHEVFREDPLLIRPGDRVEFRPVTEDELLQARRDVLENRYEYMISDDVFSVAGYLDGIAPLAAEAERARLVREAAAAGTEVP